MLAACALGMISGKYIFNFGIAERLRTLRYPIFTGGTEGKLSDFCAKNHRKDLKVLFMVSELCDTVFTGKAPEQNRHTGGKHHEGF
ncbi:MAG: hypothetical protein EGR21_08455 [Faecalibacterium prausnitzii]|nr:hypothetical protein [Faecalibacterium prausnitzii]